jgi:hypothetical protein
MNLGVQLNAGDHFLHLPAGGIPATVAPLGFVKVPVARLTGCYQQLDAMGVSYDPLSVFVDPTALQNLTARCADFPVFLIYSAAGAASVPSGGTFAQPRRVLARQGKTEHFFGSCDM